MEAPPQEEITIDDLDRQLAALKMEEQRRIEEPFAVLIPYTPTSQDGAFARCQVRRCKAAPAWLMKAKNGKVSASCESCKALQWEIFQYRCRLSDALKKPDQENLADAAEKDLKPIPDEQVEELAKEMISVACRKDAPAPVPTPVLAANPMQ